MPNQVDNVNFQFPVMSMILNFVLIQNDTSWRRKWQPAPVLLPGKSHGQRSMVGSYSSRGRKESDTAD